MCSPRDKIAHLNISDNWSDANDEVYRFPGLRIYAVILAPLLKPQKGFRIWKRLFIWKKICFFLGGGLLLDLTLLVIAISVFSHSYSKNLSVCDSGRLHSFSEALPTDMLSGYQWSRSAGHPEKVIIVYEWDGLVTWRSEIEITKSNGFL